MISYEFGVEKSGKIKKKRMDALHGLLLRGFFRGEWIEFEPNWIEREADREIHGWIKIDQKATWGKKKKITTQ